MRTRPNPKIPENIVERYRRAAALAKSTTNEGEKRNALAVVAQLEAQYPGIATYTVPPYERARPMGAADWMRSRTKATSDGVTPTALVEKLPDLFPWAELMPWWTKVSAGVFVGIRKGGLVDVYVNNTYKMTSPSLRAVVLYLVDLIQSQPGAAEGDWKGYNVFVGKESPPELDRMPLPLVDIAMTVGMLSTPGSSVLTGRAHAPGILEVPVMDPDEFEAEE